MGLLDGALAAVFAEAFSGFYLDATLHPKNTADGDDGAGGGEDREFLDDVAVKAQLDATTQRQQSGEGFTDMDQRILVLASGIREITTDDEITVDGRRWAISSVTTDPAGAYYDLRGRLSGREDS